MFTKTETRIRAISYCVFYGLVPSRFYERTPHHSFSYLTHLWANVTYAWRWLTFQETDDDREFERDTNNAK